MYVRAVDYRLTFRPTPGTISRFHIYGSFCTMTLGRFLGINGIVMEGGGGGGVWANRSRTRCRDRSVLFILYSICSFFNLTSNNEIEFWHLALETTYPYELFRLAGSRTPIPNPPVLGGEPVRPSGWFVHVAFSARTGHTPTLPSTLPCLMYAQERHSETCRSGPARVLLKTTTGYIYHHCPLPLPLSSPPPPFNLPILLFYPSTDYHHHHHYHPRH